MATREQIHKLVDELGETDLDPVAEFIASRGENGTAAEAGKPGDVIDDWGNLSAMTRASSGRMLKRLDDEELAEFGETIADAWGYESPK